jgi:hypothetical protein
MQNVWFYMYFSRQEFFNVGHAGSNSIYLVALHQLFRIQHHPTRIKRDLKMTTTWS